MSRPTAKLLISLHDVSPVSWGSTQAALELLAAAGVPRRALTLFVIPEHEGRFHLAEFPDFVAWLKSVAADGASLVAHGLSHRMLGRPRAWRELPWAYLFAAGQGEFYNVDRAEAHTKLERVRQIFRQVGLDRALEGFVPPAWLLSREAQAEFKASEFRFIETLRGIRCGSTVLARRLIGRGARNLAEACVTSLHAELQTLRRPADTRYAIHPADLGSRICVGSIQRSLARLQRAHEPLSYETFLALRVTAHASVA